MTNYIFKDKAQSQGARLGVLTVQIPKTSSEFNFCIKSYTQLYNLTEKKNEATVYKLSQLFNLQNADTCNDNDPNIPEDLTGKFALASISRPENRTSNCSIYERAQIIADRHGIGFLSDRPLSSRFNATDYNESLAVASIYRDGDKESILELQKDYSEDGTFILYAPPNIAKAFDLSLVIILLMAVFTISVGSVWSGFTKRAL